MLPGLSVVGDRPGGGEGYRLGVDDLTGSVGVGCALYAVRSC